MICKNCNKEIPDNVNTCIFCGNKIIDSPSSENLAPLSINITPPPTPITSEPINPQPSITPITPTPSSPITPPPVENLPPPPPEPITPPPVENLPPPPPEPITPPPVENIPQPEPQLKKKSNKIFLLFFILIFIVALLLSIKYIFPIFLNKSNNSLDSVTKDAQSMNDSAILLTSIDQYYFEKGIYPWQDDQKSNANILTSLKTSPWFSKLNNPKLANENSDYTLYSKDGIYIFVCYKSLSTDNIKKAAARCLTDPEIKDTDLCKKGKELTCAPNNLSP